MRLLAPAPALETALAVLHRSPRAVVLVDGRSGSGKTTFAAALANRARARLLRLDDVYPGWDGLAAASRALVDGVLVPHGAGEIGALRTWDWGADRPAGVLPIQPGGPLVVEGCGALSRRAAELAAFRVWVELPDEERRERALARDGAAFAPHWTRWARQERAFLAREDPRRSADVLIDGRRFPQATFSDRPGDTHYPRRS